MAAIEIVVFAAGAGFAFVVVMTIIVIVGVRREERYLTLTQRSAPGVTARLARMVLGRYVRHEQDWPIEGRYPDDPLAPRERATTSPR